MRREMKNLVLLLLIVSAMICVTGCGNDDTDRKDRGSTASTVTPGKGKKTPGEGQTTPTDTQIPTPTETPTLKTAEKPAALNIRDVKHVTGVKEYYTDEETGKTFEVIEDSGEDGLTMTKNCYNDEGKLVWWESFKYDSESKVTEIIRRESVNNDMIMQKVLYYNGDEYCGMDVYEALPGSEGDTEVYKTLQETFYPGGALHTLVTYYPYTEAKRYQPNERTEYAEDGTETYHALYFMSGEVDKEYINGERVYKVPETATEMFVFLNEASDEDFEGIWKSCQRKIEVDSLTEQWNTVCEVFSGYYDIYGTGLARLRNEYGLKLFASGSQPSGSLSSAQKNAFYNRDKTAWYKSVIECIDNNKVNPLLLAKVYREGCYPDLGGTIWLPSEYKEATKSLKKVERNEGESIRILVVDYSEKIWNDKISRDLLLEDSKYSERMVERAETILKGLFTSVSSKVCFTSYPELADVVFEIRTEYPYAGKYSYSNGTIAEVWNLSMNVKAINKRGKGETSATFEHKAGNKVSTKGGTNIFMRVPDVTEDEYRDKAEKFTETVLSWFSE